MKQQKFTLTVGIPAHNEEANIGMLLMGILQQQLQDAVLENIVVVSDGSTDNTIAVARSVADRRITVINQKKRKGLNKTENLITKRSSSDILVLLDADVLPQNRLFLQEIVQSFLANETLGIVGVKTVPLQPQTTLERILVCSHNFKVSMYKKINNADNIYLCHGRARGFRKSLYSKLVLPANCPEDAYSYLLCKKKGYDFSYNPKAAVYFRTPATVLDQVRQSKRFIGGISLLKKEFGKKTVSQAFNIPLDVFIQSFVFFFLRQPITATAYLLFQVYVRFFNKDRIQYMSVYDASASTKKLMTAFFPMLLSAQL